MTNSCFYGVGFTEVVHWVAAAVLAAMAIGMLPMPSRIKSHQATPKSAEVIEAQNFLVGEQCSCAQQLLNIGEAR